MASKHITLAGAKKLEDELDHLWKEERPKLLVAIAEAAAMGDRSENAEYIYGKKRLRQIDSRVRWLRKRLGDVVIVNDLPNDQNKIFFGAYIELKDQNGKCQKYQLVGSDEVGEAGTMSMESPLGRALKGKEKGDVISLELPVGKKTFEVLDVKY